MAKPDDHHVDSAVAGERLAQVVLADHDSGVTLEPLAGEADHRRRAVEADGFGHLRSDVEHEGREPAVAAAEVEHAGHVDGERLGELGLSGAAGRQPADAAHVFLDLRLVAPGTTHWAIMTP